MKKYSRKDCEFLRQQAKEIFDDFRVTWCDLLRWALPSRGKWILSQTPGQRTNQHIVDPTHILGLRSFRAGFLEGNTSASRPWFRIGTRDGELGENEEERAWLQHYTSRVLSYFAASNFYNAAGIFYADYGVVNTGAHYFEVLDNGNVFVHTLIPGSYYAINNSYNTADILVREFTLNVKSVVDSYGKLNSSGGRDWSNISRATRKMYEDGHYTQKVDIVHVIKENPNFDPNNPDVPDNRQWLELTYELGGGTGYYFSPGQEFGNVLTGPEDDLFLKVFTGKRKPFIVGKSTETSEYGEDGPTLMSLGLIKSLNKKAIVQDQALEQMVKPALQGPASLRKTYVSHSPSSFVPIDARSAGKQKLETIFEINPAIGALLQNVGDMRQQVDKLYFADFLLYLSKNPKTRTAFETDAIIEEQQRIIGPNLQSLNTTYNIPAVEWFMDFVLFEDPYLKPVPESLEGQVLKPEFVSVFAQAQKAADLPSVDRYVAMVERVAQINPQILQKLNVDKYADIYEDRLYLPSGLNNPQSKVDAMREQAQAQAERKEALQNTLPAMAKAAKDAGMTQQGQQQQAQQ